jgi:hypothetical protein
MEDAHCQIKKPVEIKELPTHWRYTVIFYGMGGGGVESGRLKSRQNRKPRCKIIRQRRDLLCVIPVIISSA